MTTTDVQAARLIRWYPRVWRDRYGEEFADLLCAEIDEQPQSWRRDLDVRLHGAKARLTAVGLSAGRIHDPQASRFLRAAVLTIFVASATSLWGQVLNASSSAPWAHPAVAAMRVVIATTFSLFALVGLATGWSLTRRTASLVRTHRRHLTPPLLLIGLGATSFAAGLHIAWSNLHEAITATSLSRALTQSITTYWAHPSMLAHSYDGSTQLWIFLSPISVAVLVTGLVRLCCAVDELTPAPARPVAPRWITPLLMASTFAVSAWWVIGSRQYAQAILRAGTLDLALITAMALSLGILARTSRTAVRRS